jgi:hypothetical protein
MRVMVACWVLPLAILAMACGDGTGHTEGRVRAASAAEASSSAQLIVDERVLASGYVSEVFGKYYAISVGRHIVSVVVDGIASEESIEVEADVDYTVVHSGIEGQPATVFADSDDNDTLDDESDVLAEADAPNVRFVHGSSSAGLVDIYLSAPDKALSEVAPLTFDLKNGDVTGFQATDKGVYRLRVTKATFIDQVLFDSGPFTLDGQGNLSFVMLDVPGGTGAGALKFLVLTDTGSWTLGAFNPCAADVADDTLATARPFVGAFALDGLCRAGDVDFFKLDLTAAKLAVIEVSTAGLGSLLNSTLELQGPEGIVLDKSARDSTGKARSRVLLFGGQSYYIRVGDSRGQGGANYTYELRVSLLDENPTVEAAGGAFNAASNDKGILAFAGQFVALSARRADNKPLDYKSMVRVTGLGTSRYDFVYDAALATDGVLRVILSDGKTPLPHVTPLALPGGLMASQAFSSDWLVASPSRISSYRATRAMGVAFPTRDLTWNANTDSALAPAAVTTVQLNEARTSARVTFTVPARATTFDLLAYGRDSAAVGRASATSSPVSVTLDGPLATDEAYAVRVQAGDVGLLKLPLGNKALNVSEFLFYSDAE